MLLLMLLLLLMLIIRGQRSEVGRIVNRES
jgi:hypothetical protein